MSQEKHFGRIRLRYKQLLGSVAIGIGFTVVGTLIWNLQNDSPPSRLLLIILMGPGTIFSILVNGVHDVSIRTVQIANAVIYSGLGYILLRFVEWLKSEQETSN
jgi:hypothetical protein